MTRQLAVEPLVAATWLLEEYYCERGPKFARKFISWDYNTASLTHFLRFICVVSLFLKKITYLSINFIYHKVDLVNFFLELSKVTVKFLVLSLQYIREV